MDSHGMIKEVGGVRTLPPLSRGSSNTAVPGPEITMAVPGPAQGLCHAGEKLVSVSISVGAGVCKYHTKFSCS